MILKLFAKLWPSLTPILLYIFWTYVVERIIFKTLLKNNKTNNKTIEGTKVVGQKSTMKTVPATFSLKNKKFLTSLYASLIIAIISLIFFALSDTNSQHSDYIPAKYENGNITPSHFKQ